MTCCLSAGRGGGTFRSPENCRPQPQAEIYPCKIGVGTEAIAILPAKRVVSAFTDDNRTWALMRARKPAQLRKAS